MGQQAAKMDSSSGATNSPPRAEKAREEEPGPASSSSSPTPLESSVLATASLAGSTAPESTNTNEDAGLRPRNDAAAPAAPPSPPVMSAGASVGCGDAAGPAMVSAAGLVPPLAPPPAVAAADDAGLVDDIASHLGPLPLLLPQLPGAETDWHSVAAPVLAPPESSSSLSMLQRQEGPAFINLQARLTPPPAPKTPRDAVDVLVSCLNSCTSNAVLPDDHPLCAVVLGGMASTSSVDACAGVVRLLQHQAQTGLFSFPVVLAAVQAFERLWQRDRGRIAELGGYVALMSALHTCIVSTDVTFAGLAVLRTLAAHDAETRAHLRNSRCNEHVLGCSRVWDRHQDVYRLVFAVVEAMAADDESLVRLGQDGVVEALTRLFKGGNYPPSAETAEQGCRTLQVLARDYSLLRSMTKAGINDQLISSLSLYPQSRALQESGMAAMVHLAFTADNMRKLGKHGAVEVVVRSLQLYPYTTENRGLIEVALMLVRRLAMDQYNRRRLARQQAPQVVCHVMRESRADGKLQEWACAAISILALDDDMRDTLRACGAGEGVTNALANFDADRGLQNVAKLALRRLSSSPSTQADHRGRGLANRPRSADADAPRQPFAAQAVGPQPIAPPAPPGPVAPVLYSTVAASPPRRRPQPHLADADATKEDLLERRRQELHDALAGQYQHVHRLSQQAQTLYVEEKQESPPSLALSALSLLEAHRSPTIAPAVAQDTVEPEPTAEDKLQVGGQQRTQQSPPPPLSPPQEQQPQQQQLPSPPSPPQQQAQPLMEVLLEHITHLDKSTTQDPNPAQQPRPQPKLTFESSFVWVPHWHPTMPASLVDTRVVLEEVAKLPHDLSSAVPTHSPLITAVGLYAPPDAMRREVFKAATVLTMLLDSSIMPISVKCAALQCLIMAIDPACHPRYDQSLVLLAYHHDLIRILLRALMRHSSESAPQLAENLALCLLLVAGKEQPLADKVLLQIMTVDPAGGIVLGPRAAPAILLEPLRSAAKLSIKHRRAQHGLILLLSSWWWYEAARTATTGLPPHSITFFLHMLSPLIAAMRGFPTVDAMQAHACLLLTSLAAHSFFAEAMVKDSACAALADLFNSYRRNIAGTTPPSFHHGLDLLEALLKYTEALWEVGTAKALCELCLWVKDERLLERMAGAVIKLAGRPDDLRRMVLSAGAVEAVTTALHHLPTRRTWQLTAACWLNDAATTLAGDADGLAKLVAGGTTAAAVEQLERFLVPCDFSILQRSVGTLLLLTQQSPASGISSATRAALIQSGAVHLLLNVLSRSHTDPPLTRSTLTLLAVLGMDAIEAATRTPVPPDGRDIHQYLCELVTSPLRQHPTDRDTQHSAIALVWMLALQSPTNRGKLGGAGACEALLTATRTFPTDLPLLGNACGALSVLADEPANRLAMLKLRGMSAMCAVLQSFPHEAALQKNGLRTWLKLMSDEVSARLAAEARRKNMLDPREEACAPILAAMRAYTLDPDLQFMASWATWLLASCEDNGQARRLLGKGGAGEMVVMALRSFPDKRDLQYVGCGALLALGKPRQAPQDSKNTNDLSCPQLITAALGPLGCGWGAGDGGANEAQSFLWGPATGQLAGKDTADGEEVELQRRLARCGARAAVEDVSRAWAAEPEVKRMAEMALQVLH